MTSEVHVLVGQSPHNWCIKNWDRFDNFLQTNVKHFVLRELSQFLRTQYYLPMSRETDTLTNQKNQTAIQLVLKISRLQITALACSLKSHTVWLKASVNLTWSFSPQQENQHQ